MRSLLDALNLCPPMMPVNGFLAVDFVFGCLRCSFCFNRAAFDRFPSEGVVHQSLSPARAAALIATTPLLPLGTVVKVGYNSDQSLQQAASWKFLEHLPVHTLVAFARRTPLSKAEASRFLTAPCAPLLVLTLTPASRTLGIDGAEAWAALASSRGVQRCLYAVRPIARDALDEARNLIHALPPRSLVDICELIDRSNSPLAAPAASANDIQALKEEAVTLGHRPMRSVNCVLRGEAGLGSHWADQYLTGTPEPETSTCRTCPSVALCLRGGPSPEALATLTDRARHETGLGDLQVRRVGPRKLEALTGMEWHRGDGTYLRNLFGCRVVSAAGKVRLDITESIAARWERSGFFPVQAVGEAALDAVRAASSRTRSSQGETLLGLARKIDEPAWQVPFPVRDVRIAQVLRGDHTEVAEVVLRDGCGAEVSRCLRVDRDGRPEHKQREFAALTLAGEVGLAPRALAYGDNPPRVICEWIDNLVPIPAETSLARPNFVNRCGAAYARLHALAVPNQVARLLDLRTLGSHTEDLRLALDARLSRSSSPSHLARLAAHWSDAIDPPGCPEANAVLVQGSPGRNNLMLRDASPVFVDWDTARLAPPEYDLAAFLVTVAATPEETCAFLSAYEPSINHALLRFYIPAVALWKATTGALGLLEGDTARIDAIRAVT